MAAGVNGAMTQSTAARWMGRWAVGVVIGQILFGGTVRLVLVMLFGAALGGLGVWLVQRNRAPISIRRISSFPPLTRRTAPHLTPRTTVTRTGRSPGSATRRRYSPLARPQTADATGRPSMVTGRPGIGEPRRRAG